MQFAKNPIAMLFVEVRRLKTEGVQIDILCAALPRFRFSNRQKAMPISTTAKFVFDPQQVDVAPIPIDFADHTAYNFLVRRANNETYALMLIIACLLCVVIPDAASNSLPDRFVRLIDVEDAIFFIHMILQFLSCRFRFAGPREK